MFIYKTPYKKAVISFIDEQNFMKQVQLMFHFKVLKEA